MASLLLSFAGRATAEELPACRLEGGAWPRPAEYERVGDLAAYGVVPDVRQMLGQQFAFFWGQVRDLGWYIGVAPGPVDLEAARAYVLSRVDAHYSGEDARLLREHLRVVSQPYGEPELRAIQSELAAELAGWGVGWVLGPRCEHSDAYRLELWLFDNSTDAVVAAARALTARWGDRVLVIRMPGGPPRPLGRLPPIVEAPPLARPRNRTRLADLLVGRSCVRDRKAVLRVRRSARGRIERVTVTAGGRRSVFRDARLSRALRVPLGRRTRTVRIAVRLRDGTTVSAKQRPRSCRRR